jgi:hydroxyacylglutathione hydrolase
MGIPLEDAFTDVLGKAQRGLGVSDSQLAERAGISLSQLQQLRSGAAEPETLRAVASVLKLNAGALSALAAGSWMPEPVEVPGLAMFTTPFDDITVNSYIVTDPSGAGAIAFDTGADCEPMLAFLSERKLALKLILITHTHGDHIYDLDRLKERTGAEAYAGSREPLNGAHAFEAGASFSLGALAIDTRLTWGHSRGGITYVVRGLARQLAVVGDAVFAGSMGGGAVSYADALKTNRAEILSLSDETVICPGHGPLTTVGEEKAHNPFFA